MSVPACPVCTIIGTIAEAMNVNFDYLLRTPYVLLWRRDKESLTLLPSTLNLMFSAALIVHRLAFCSTNSMWIPRLLVCSTSTIQNEILPWTSGWLGLALPNPSFLRSWILYLTATHTGWGIASLYLLLLPQVCDTACLQTGIATFQIHIIMTLPSQMHFAYCQFEWNSHSWASP